jgi:ADP-ribose pyrophosphatase YjhB (NUDIX family)
MVPPRRLPRARRTLEDSIRKHLAAKVDVRELSHLEQLETRSEPERHPSEWQLATAYLGLVPRGVEPVGCANPVLRPRYLPPYLPGK